MTAALHIVYNYIDCVFFDRQVALYSGDKGQCSRLSTSGVDGQLVIWDLKVTFPDWHITC